VGDAGIGVKGQRPAAGGAAHVGAAGPAPADQGGQFLVPQGVAAERGVQAHHGRLLLDLVVAAEHGEAGMAGDVMEHLGRLAPHALPELWL
jgi:hypothetical protein